MASWECTVCWRSSASASAAILSLLQVEELTALPRVTDVKDGSADVTLLGDPLSCCADTGVAVHVGIASLVTFAGAHGARGVW